MDPRLRRVDVVEFVIGSSEVSFFFRFLFAACCDCDRVTCFCLLVIRLCRVLSFALKISSQFAVQQMFQQITSHLVVRKPSLGQDFSPFVSKGFY